MTTNSKVFEYRELGDCIDLVIDHRGKTPKKLGSDWVETGIPTISAKNVNSGKLVAQNAIRFVTQGVYEKWMKEDVKTGDCFLVSEGATLGECLYWDNDYPIVLGQRIFCIRTNPEILYPRYFYVYMTSSAFQSEVVGRATGSSVAGLRQTEVLKLRVKILPMEEQIFIGDLFYNINKKIDKNAEANQTLESIAQAIFKSWFVDFDPVKAKIAALEAGGTQEAAELAAICVISGKDEAQLAQFKIQDADAYQQLVQTAALFPAAMQESELGEIPDGWKVNLSGDLIDVRDGTHDSPKQSEIGFPLVTSTHITTGILNLNDTYLISADDFEKVNQRSKVAQFDILLTMIGTVGSPYLVMQSSVNFAIKNVALFRTSQAKELRYFFYLLLKSNDMQIYLDSRTAGTTQKYLSLKVLRNIEVIVPPKKMLLSFDYLIDPIMQEIKKLIDENECLVLLRDSLLPKLLSGEITIPDFENSQKELAE